MNHSNQQLSLARVFQLIDKTSPHRGHFRIQFADQAGSAKSREIAAQLVKLQRAGVILIKPQTVSHPAMPPHDQSSKLP